MTEVEETDTQIRAYWNDRAENVRSDEELADLLAHLLIVDQNTFQIALPTLCILSARELSEQRKREFEEICAGVLLDPESTRPSRRAVLACLKEFRAGATWTEFYTLIEALEEPQFHIIRPILPRFDTLLSAVVDGKLDFVWAKIALLRAILHTNGWIRVWAIEKSVSIDSEVLRKNHEFITQLVIPNLNNNDVFWRHLEKGRMEENLLNLGKVLEAVKSAPSFLQNLLLVIESLSCPTAIFFVVSTLRNVSSEPILTSEDVALMRRAVLRARYIPHKSMRMITIRNLVLFYAKVTKLDETVLDELANLIAFFSSESTLKMTRSTFVELQKIIISVGYTSPEHHDERFFEQKYQNDTKNLSEHSRMFWISMGNDTGRQEKMLSRLQLEVSDVLGEKPVKDLTMQLYLLNEKPDGLINGSSDVLHCMRNDLGEYILTQIISTRGTKFDAQLLDTLFLPLFFKYCTYVFRFPFAIAIVQIAPESKSCEALALQLTFLDAILGGIPDGEDDILASGYFSYLGGETVISMARQKKSVEEYDTKEFNQIVATAHSLRIKLLNRFTKLMKADDVDDFLLECVEQLDVASAFSVKQQICHLIARFIRFGQDPNIPIQCIRACSNIVNEEKKSLNSLPALQSFVSVALRGPERNAREIIEMLETQLAIANQSTPVALILVDSLMTYRANLTTEWAQFIVKLALFGPVPKKESRVISFAYSKIFEEEESLLEKDPIERLEEVVQKARFKAVLLALKLSDSCSAWPIALINEIFKASAVMDQSSSRSFGLSMAHRQKTRAVELLHLLTAKIQDEKAAETIFEFCIACVVDPCQQFSIKLIVEWTLARLCIKFEKLFQKLVDKEFETKMAAKRIGSMCSWLNVLMLISRAAPQLTDTCLDKVIVWCTAQNFPVRCTALAAARLMFSTFDKDKRKKWRLVKAIVNFDAEPSGNSKRVIDNLCTDFYFAKLHVAKHFDFQTILTEIARRTGMPPEETIPEAIIRELNDTKVASFNEDKEFLTAPSEVYSALSKNASCAPSMENEDVAPPEEDVTDDAPEEVAASSFQRKIVKDQEVRDDISLIVVASLVDKPNNLGGICRTSEIFGVDTLVVADVLVAQDTSFKALSMSSENWQKIEGVKPANLLPYLQNLRANGYTVIAAEQTTDSVMMHDFVFPKKAVIVMGDEKEGVPVNLLRAVDQTVEIKQVGHTRSLNVHVTAALMIAKFAEQVRFSN